MDLNRAIEIVGICTQHVFYREGLIDKKPPSLADVSLRELIEAHDLLRVENDKPSVNGQKVIYTVCDDRLLAAIYVA